MLLPPSPPSEDVPKRVHGHLGPPGLDFLQTGPEHRVGSSALMTQERRPLVLPHVPEPVFLPNKAINMATRFPTDWPSPHPHPPPPHLLSSSMVRWLGSEFTSSSFICWFDKGSLGTAAVHQSFPSARCVGRLHHHHHHRPPPLHQWSMGCINRDSVTWCDVR